MTPPRRLTARRLAQDLTSIAVLNVATVTARGEPRISALDGHFCTAGGTQPPRGRRPKSDSYAPGPGSARPTRRGTATASSAMGRSGCCNRDRTSIEALTDHCVRVYGQSPLEWGPDIAYLTIEPSWLVGFAMTDAELAEIEAQKAERAANADSRTGSAQPT